MQGGIGGVFPTNGMTTFALQAKILDISWGETKLPGVRIPASLAAEMGGAVKWGVHILFLQAGSPVLPKIVQTFASAPENLSGPARLLAIGCSQRTG